MKFVILLLLGLSFSSGAFAERLIELRQDILVAESIGYYYGPNLFTYQKTENIDSGEIAYVVKEETMDHALGEVYGFDVSSDEHLGAWNTLFSNAKANALKQVSSTQGLSFSQALNKALNLATKQNILFSITR